MSDFLDTEDQDDNNDFDVIIVGSGLTGLTAAYFLLKKEIGLNVLILEATGEYLFYYLIFILVDYQLSKFKKNIYLNRKHWWENISY